MEALDPEAVVLDDHEEVEIARTEAVCMVVASVLDEPDDVARRMAAFARVRIDSDDDDDSGDSGAELRFMTSPPEPIERDMETLGALLRSATVRGEITFILCDNVGQLERLEEILDAQDAHSDYVRLALGALHGGFLLEGREPAARVLTDHEIFARTHRPRRGRRFRGAVALESLAQLTPGDYVVHMDHGVGQRPQGGELARLHAEPVIDQAKRCRDSQHSPGRHQHIAQRGCGAGLQLAPRMAED